MQKKPVLTLTSECHLESGSGALVEALKRHLTIDNPKYLSAKKYGRWVGKKLKRQLVFYVEDREGISFPRGFTGRAIGLCRKHMGSAPTIVDRRRLLPPVPFGFAGELRPYQQEAVAAVLEKHFGVLVAGTGSGKTVMALAVVAARQQPTLVLVHTKELLYQWRDRIREFLQVEPGLIGDGNFSIEPVSVAIVNTARRRLQELPSHFGQVVVDECHRVPATLFTEVVTAFDCQFVLGLSATAYRREDGMTSLIYFFMGERIHRVDPRRLEAVGAVLKPEFVQRPTSFQYRFRGDYQALMTALTLDEKRNCQIVDDIVMEAKSGRGMILVVSDRVAHCERLAALLTDRGLEPFVLTGRAAADERTAIINAVRRDSIKILISTLQLVGEGFDAAGLTVLVLTTPIKFSGRLRQVIGRVLRPAAGKKPKVIDYIDAHVGVLRASAQARLLSYQ